MIRTVVMISGLSMASALVVGTPMMRNARVSSPMMATAGEWLASNNGPDLYWEEKGPLQDPPKEESDFKEYDTFSDFLAACSSFGVDLSAPDITVFAPGNKAVAEFTSTAGPLTAAICGYHVVKGVVGLDGLASGDLSTTEGSTITYRRMFRKHFVDNAFCGAMQNPPRTSFPGDIKVDNGVIHMVNEVIYPGWSESAGGYGSDGGMGEATRT